MASQQISYEKIHHATTLGPVHYNVIDIDRMVIFYRDIIGMHVWRHDADCAVLGTEVGELLRMTKVAPARVNGQTEAGASRRTTGLYHTAFLVPTKRDLAHLTRTLIATRTPVQGTSDHGTHLALYLPDPEGNGIELAWDHPREQWPEFDGRPDPTAAPRRGVDIEDLLATVADDEQPWSGVSPGTTVGHIHLHVADLDESTHFYNETVGLDIILHSSAMGASFLSAGGYHHHVGMNIWHGRGLPPAAPEAPGLRYFTLVVPNGSELARVTERIDGCRQTDLGPVYGAGSGATPQAWLTDPAGIRILLTTPD